MENLEVLNQHEIEQPISSGESINGFDGFEGVETIDANTDTTPGPLQIRLKQDVGKLPKDIILQMPHDISCSLIMRRLATPVANLDTMADLVLTDEDMEHSGVYEDAVWRNGATSI